MKDRGLPIAAEAAFRELEPACAEYRKLDLNVPQKDLKWQLEGRRGKLKKLEEQYTAVVKLGVAEPAVCALERIGRLYEHFARVFHDAPVPRRSRPTRSSWRCTRPSWPSRPSRWSTRPRRG